VAGWASSKQSARRWGSGTSAIARALLAATGPLRGVSLAASAQVSQPRASQVLAQLLDHRAVRAGTEGYSAHAALLMDLYRQRSRPALVSAEMHWYSTRTLRDQAARVVNCAREAQSQVAFSADLGPDLLVPWRHPTVAVVYSSAALELDALGFVRAEGRPGASIIVRWTQDRTLLVPAEPWPAAVDGLPLTDPTQQWWDLLDLGGEDRKEAADRLQQAILTHSLPCQV
jgi:hypothetical protein